MLTTGANEQRPYGMTRSDLTQQLLPRVLLDAMPCSRVESSRVLQIAAPFELTRPFDGQHSAPSPSGDPHTSRTDGL